jgi:hypothetical protein
MAVSEPFHVQVKPSKLAQPLEILGGRSVGGDRADRRVTSQAAPPAEIKIVRVNPSRLSEQPVAINRSRLTQPLPSLDGSARSVERPAKPVAQAAVMPVVRPSRLAGESAGIGGRVEPASRIASTQRPGPDAPVMPAVRQSRLAEPLPTVGGAIKPSGSSGKPAALTGVPLMARVREPAGVLGGRESIGSLISAIRDSKKPAAAQRRPVMLSEPRTYNPFGR